MQNSRAITRKSASNLALAFILLPREKRDAMSALYAFCREVDDAADDETVPAEKRRAQLAEWRADVKRACENQPPQFPVNRELRPVIKRFHLPFELFDELIKGCEMDLDTKRYEDFGQLELYCHRVASVVGLLSIEIFGYKNPASRDYAIYLGKALQLTNILRDVKSDAARGRIYLPLGELKKFNVGEDEILNSVYSENYSRARAKHRRTRENFLFARAKNVAAARLQINGRRRIDGFGLLAVAAKTGTRAVQCFWRATIKIKQAAKAHVDFPLVAAFCFQFRNAKLWNGLILPDVSLSTPTISAFRNP